MNTTNHPLNAVKVATAGMIGLLSTAVLAGTATAANAAPMSSPVSVTAASAAAPAGRHTASRKALHHKAAPKNAVHHRKHKASNRKSHKHHANTAARKFGNYPVTPEAIARYHLRPKQIRDIAKAHKLARTAQGRKITRAESNNQYDLVYGGYYGAWQFNRGTWQSNGGGQFSRTANLAPAWAQDYIMYKTHKSRGWSPWSTR